MSTTKTVHMVIKATVHSIYGDEDGTLAPPVNVGLPVVTGLPYVGQTLTTTNGMWTGFPPPTYTYQWFKAPSTAIAGATNSTYTLVAGDDGENIFCRVTATNSEGSASADAAAVGPIATPVAPSETSAPVISGPGTVGAQHSVSTPAVWNLGNPVATVTSTWRRNGTPIAGSENASTYTPVQADDGTVLSYQETATNIAAPSGVIGTASNGITIGTIVTEVRVTSEGENRVTSEAEDRVAA